jgi:hypothetical protein
MFTVDERALHVVDVNERRMLGVAVLTFVESDSRGVCERRVRVDGRVCRNRDRATPSMVRCSQTMADILRASPRCLSSAPHVGGFAVHYAQGSCTSSIFTRAVAASAGVNGKFFTRLVDLSALAGRPPWRRLRSGVWRTRCGRSPCVVGIAFRVDDIPRCPPPSAGPGSCVNMVDARSRSPRDRRCLELDSFSRHGWPHESRSLA